ncbi:hypothetical protein [Streptomyces sp. NPDC059863]
MDRGPGARGYNHGDWTSPRPGALAEVRQRIASAGRSISGRGCATAIMPI